jgi:hypothetical protein
MPPYLVIDTESSLRLDTRLRVLVSLAYEVVATEDDSVRAAGYDIVRHSPGCPLDPRSLRVHHIDADTARVHGKPLRAVLANLASVIRKYQPVAVVGHDVQGDVCLLVSECLRLNLSPAHCFGNLFRWMVCTKLGGAVPCGIPLPGTGGAATFGRGRLKWPNLAECYERLVLLRPPSSSAAAAGLAPPCDWPCHDARGDVERCRAVFLRLLARTDADADETDTEQGGGGDHDAVPASDAL